MEMDELQTWALTQGDRTAWQLIGPKPQEVSYRSLDRNSNRCAQLLLSFGLEAGQTIGLMLPNGVEFVELAWAARRLGLYYTPISTRILDAEATYILADSGARALFVTADRAGIEFDGPKFIVGDGNVNDSASYEAALDRFREGAPLPCRPIGRDFVYSSGTTGRPKGVRRNLHPDLASEQRQSDWIQRFSQHGPDSVCMFSAPLYHAAPLRFAMRSIQQGGTLIAHASFDAARCLETIEKFRVTHSLWVPTMFYRLLQLPESVRSSYDTGSLKLALHSGGPCSAEIKERMIKWWGTIVWEYYAASEGNGATAISPQEALSHPGSVGRAVLGKLHILDKDQREVGVGVDGDIYFEGGPEFAYHNDQAKTAESRTAQGWTSVGDIGHVDGEGYLYLSDRKAHTIVSGGVNIYPAEIEHVLLEHPVVADAAVFGLPDAEFGEEVKAVIQLRPGVIGDERTAQVLHAHCQERLASLKRPKSISFEVSLPRTESGKLPKGELKKRYIAGACAPSFRRRP